MNFFRKATIPLFLILLSLAIFVYFYAIGHGAVLANANLQNLKTVIIDAGHGGLTNTTH